LVWVRQELAPVIGGYCWDEIDIEAFEIVLETPTTLLVDRRRNCCQHRVGRRGVGSGRFGQQGTRDGRLSPLKPCEGTLKDGPLFTGSYEAVSEGK
jgi:hypothetical protein